MTQRIKWQKSPRHRSGARSARQMDFFGLRCSRCLDSGVVSDSSLRLIAIDPKYIPTTAAAELARQTLARLVPGAEEVTATITDDVQFVDQGANFERVLCPKCGIALTEEWWQARMDEAATTRFAALEVVTPCCSTQTSLNDLTYEWPAGFARFVLEAMNPKVREVPQEDIEQISAILDAPLRTIWAHY